VLIQHYSANMGVYCLAVALVVAAAIATTLPARCEH
jgi:hypothetical protein